MKVVRLLSLSSTILRCCTTNARLAFGRLVPLRGGSLGFGAYSNNKSCVKFNQMRHGTAHGNSLCFGAVWCSYAACPRSPRSCSMPPLVPRVVRGSMLPTFRRTEHGDCASGPNAVSGNSTKYLAGKPRSPANARKPRSSALWINLEIADAKLLVQSAHPFREKGDLPRVASTCVNHINNRIAAPDAEALNTLDEQLCCEIIS